MFEQSQKTKSTVFICLIDNLNFRKNINCFKFQCPATSDVSFSAVFYGIICIGLTFAVSKVDSIVIISNTFLSIMEGPILAVYFVAVLSRKGSEKVKPNFFVDY